MDSYKFRESYRGSKKVSAAIVMAELERVRATGELTAARTLEMAKAKDAPLHPCFEWNDRQAGAEYRLWQARQLIRAVVVVSQEEGEKAEPARSVFVHVPEPDMRQGKYVRLANATADLDEYERALGEAQRFLDAAENRFNELRRLVQGRGDRAEALAIAIQGFATLREAMALLK